KNDLATIEIFEWGHPANIYIDENNNKHFVYCDNFTKVNLSLEKHGYKKINWNPGYKGDNSLLDQFHYCPNADDMITEKIKNYNNPFNVLNLYNDFANTPQSKRIEEF